MFDDLISEYNAEVENETTKKLEDATIKGNKKNFSKFPYNKKKQDTPQEPYIPVAFYVDREFPNEIKDKFYHIISKLIPKGITVRINGDDKDFVQKVQTLSDKNIEVYIPWKNFNDIESKHYFNSISSKETARVNFLGWEKVPDSVKSILARNVRMLFGDRNNSITLCLITWSSDGANKLIEINNNTGRIGFIIKVACKHFIPVINLGKANSEALVEKFFGI